MASVSAFGNLGQTNYGAAKAGAIGFTKCLARDLARNGVTVNCIAPSYVDTDMLRAVPEATMQPIRISIAIPLGRLGKPEELAAAAAFPGLRRFELHHGRMPRRLRRSYM